MIWSILICTIPTRKLRFNQLVNGLLEQINDRQLTEEVEILWMDDVQGEKITIGQKRQQLIAMAQGKYISFIDDDDEVSIDYVRIIHNELLKAPDVIGITGIMTVNNKQKTARKFIHSSQYKSYFEKDRVYYRCPNHLNPMLKEIAELVPFEYKSHGEDTEWALKLSALNPYHKELFIEKPIYFYKYIVKPIYK
jgi:hypothetical protein